MLIRALEQKDPYTAGHAERVAEYARLHRRRARLHARPPGAAALRGADARHRQARRAEPAAEQAGQAHRGGVRARAHPRGRVGADAQPHRLPAADRAARAQRHDAVRPRRPRSPDRAVHHHGRRRLRRHDLDPFVPQGAAAGGRVPGAARQVGHAVPPRVRRGADPRDREAQRGARQGPRGGLALRGRARGRLGSAGLGDLLCPTSEKSKQ